MANFLTKRRQGTINPLPSASTPSTTASKSRSGRRKWAFSMPSLSSLTVKKPSLLTSSALKVSRKSSVPEHVLLSKVPETHQTHWILEPATSTKEQQSTSGSPRIGCPASVISDSLICPAMMFNAAFLSLFFDLSRSSKCCDVGDGKDCFFDASFVSTGSFVMSYQKTIT